MAKLKNVVRGAALGTLLGSLAVALYPKRFEILDAVMDQSNLGDRAKDYANLLFGSNHGQEARNHYLTGGLAGLILGAGMTLFLTPKTGKQLRAQVTRAYNTLSEGRNSGINQILRAYHQATRHSPLARSRARPTKKAKRSHAHHR